MAGTDSAHTRLQPAERAHQMPEEKPIVIVSPDPETHDLCSRALQETSVPTISVATWHAVPPLAREKSLGAVLMDVLTAADWQGCRMLRDRLETSGVPVVALSGWGVPEWRYRSLAWSVGCAAYIAKPCTEQALSTTIDRVRRGEVGIAVAGPGR